MKNNSDWATALEKSLGGAPSEVEKGYHPVSWWSKQWKKKRFVTTSLLEKHFADGRVDRKTFSVPNAIGKLIEQRHYKAIK
jgi:arylamine N-acetyltransferase